MPKNRWLLFAAGHMVLLCASTLRLRADSPFTTKIFGAEQGLPESVVMTMTQTRDGYLWVGTLKEGLARFDGIHFTRFSENNTPGLKSSRIVKLFEDSHRILWIGTENAGVAFVKDGIVSNLDLGPGGRETQLMAICEDTTGGIWLYTADGRLCRYRDGKVGTWRVDSGRPGGCRALIVDEAGLLWVGNDWSLTALGPLPAVSFSGLPVAHQPPVGKLDFLLASQRGGYWCFSRDTNSTGTGWIQKWRGNRLEHFSRYLWDQRNTPVTAACEDLNGNLVIGTFGEGVFWFDADGKATHLSSGSILCLVMDREGCLWVGTNGRGLTRVKRKVFDTLEPTRDLTVQSVAQDAQGRLWVGYNGDRVDLWSGSVTQRFGLVPDFYGSSVKSASYVKAVLVDRDQRVVVGMSSPGPHLYYFENGRFQLFPGSHPFISQNVSALYQDRQGLLWVGTQAGLARWNGQTWEMFTIRDGLSTDDVRAITEDRDGNLWVGTDGGGLNRLRDGHFTSFNKTNGLPGNSVSSLWVDNENILWVGTSGGLARHRGGKWTSYALEQGLTGESVGYLIEDSQGFIWLGSTAGLIRAQKKDLNDFANGLASSVPVRAYSEADGLPGSECTFGSQPAALRSSDGRLWFPTTRGLASLNPAQLHRNTNQPPVVIESVFVGGRLQNTNRFLVGQLKEVVVPAGEERLDINYSSLNLAGAERARFKYRMTGHETEWTPAGDSRTAHYPKLPPHSYTFQVTACNEDEVWNENGATLAVTVLPPFWRKPWFLSVSALCLLGLIVGSVHFVSTQKLKRQVEKLRQQEALEKERARIARDLHDQLGANLTQVAMLGELAQSDKDSPEEVQAHAEQICQTALETTHALDEIVWTVNPSNDTLEGLVNYICKYAQDYLAIAGLRYRLDVPPQLPNTPISPELRHNVFLASKEAITNVVRHAKATEASVRLRLDTNRFTLEIEDNGRGLAGLDPNAAHTRNGLRNMRKRMEDVSGEFSISAAPEHGAIVRLTAPLASANAPT